MFEGNPTVSEVFEAYMAELATDNRPVAHQTNRSKLLEDVIEPSLGNIRYDDLTAVAMQGVMDTLALKGDERSSERTKNLFVDVEKFARRHGWKESFRTRKLLSPTNSRDPRTLSDREFTDAWRQLRICGREGAMVDRGPALLILLSAVTLRSIGELQLIRLDEIDRGDAVWRRAADHAEVYLSKEAAELIENAASTAALVHRDAATKWLFPSAGPQRDPARVLSYCQTFEVVDRVVDAKDLRPDDLRHTAIASIKRLGAEPLAGVVDDLAYRTPFKGSISTALLDAWSDRVQEMTKTVWR